MDREGLLSGVGGFAGVRAGNGWTRNLLEAGRLRAGEKLLVVVDDPLAAEGEELAEAGRAAGAEVRVARWNAAAPPLQDGRWADLVLFLAQVPKGPEATARFELGGAANEGGGREIFLGLVTPELLRGELSRPQPDLTATARGLLARLEGARELHVGGRAGTDLTLRVDGRPWLTDALELGPGDFANFPGGEVFVAPLSDGADGVLVADLTVPYTVEGLVDEPVTLRFERGRVVSIEGGRAAAMLRDLVESAGEGADVIAELGIGFNPTVSPRGHVMLDEKAADTAHVAIGRNTGSYGGDNEASIHVDCVFSAPTITVDGAPLDLP
ncbi:MAG TPA: aminopeptidase [Gaiellaceae bacterium]|nr:aminopeptidase [Gaiellaceae bacterium]